MKKPLLSINLLLPLLIGITWVLYSIRFLNQGILWDLGIYEKAALIFNAGGNAYDASFFMSNITPGIGHLFIYQPIVLRGMALFGEYLGIVMILLYVAYYFSSKV